MTNAPKPNETLPDVEPSIGDIEGALFDARDRVEVMILALTGFAKSGYSREESCTALIGQAYAIRSEILQMVSVFDDYDAFRKSRVRADSDSVEAE